jgi:hypothetical protein
MSVYHLKKLQIVKSYIFSSLVGVAILVGVEVGIVV